jgi:hypothetical protein
VGVPGRRHPDARRLPGRSRPSGGSGLGLYTGIGFREFARDLPHIKLADEEA